MAYFYLFLAIVCEVLGTANLKASNEFKVFLPSLIVLVGYASSFYFMSLSLRKLTLGLVYATWAGGSMVMIPLIGWYFYKEKLDTPSIIGLIFIVIGIILMNVVSPSHNSPNL